MMYQSSGYDDPLIEDKETNVLWEFIKGCLLWTLIWLFLMGLPTAIWLVKSNYLKG